MIIDCHGHYTTEPPQLTDYRKEQLEGVTSDPNFVPSEAAFKCTDEEMAERLEAAQLKLQAERGSDLTIFSPRALFSNCPIRLLQVPLHGSAQSIITGGYF